MLKIKPETVLRLGLGGTLLYAGLNSLLNPTGWIGFIPRWIDTLPIITRESFLTLHGIFEIALAILLLLPSLIHLHFPCDRRESVGNHPLLTLPPLLALLNMITILLIYGVDDVTFRDFGLLMAALALFLMCRKPSAPNQPH